MNLVFDSSALIAYLKTEEGAELVEELLVSSENKCYVHASNLCEVYYQVLREDGVNKAESTITVVKATGLIVREDLDEEFWRLAGQFKADHRRVSLADCYLISLACRLNAEVITCDKHELQPLIGKIPCAMRFIR